MKKGFDISLSIKSLFLPKELMFIEAFGNCSRLLNFSKYLVNFRSRSKNDLEVFSIIITNIIFISFTSLLKLELNRKNNLMEHPD